MTSAPVEILAHEISKARRWAAGAMALANSDERRRRRALRDAIGELGDLDQSAGGSAAAREWSRNRLQLRDCILSSQPRGFLQWRIIRNTMFVTNSDWVDKELHALQLSSNWHSRWFRALHEDRVGNPERHHSAKYTSPNLIHHAYSAHRFLSHAGIDLADLDAVVEFGGGYGSMCRLFRRLGFSGHYAIVDLPEFSALQRYFLDAAGVWGGGPTYLAPDASDLPVVARTGRLLVVATWSLSEAPTTVRENFLMALERPVAYLIAYQSQFGEVDNVEYFRRLADERREIDWRDEAIAHLPGSRYLLGHMVDGDPPQAE